VIRIQPMFRIYSSTNEWARDGYP